MKGRRLLLVEDDLALRTGLADTFEEEGYDVTTAADGDRAHALVFERHFDVVVLDLMLPGRGGLEILRAMREARLATPVLLLTARGDESDKVLGLDLGADDYLTKPFGLRELVARVRALLRRPSAGGGTDAESTFRIGRATVDLGAFTLTREGSTHELTPKEAGMLRILFEARGVAVRRERFLDEVWGSDAFVGPRVVDTHVVNLRHKLEDDPKAPRHLVTVHRVGYRLLLDPGDHTSS